MTGVLQPQVDHITVNGVTFNPQQGAFLDSWGDPPTVGSSALYNAGTLGWNAAALLANPTAQTIIAANQTTQTDANGEYRFDNLLPGTYSVRELQPQGYLQGGTVPGSGGGDASVQDLISSVGIFAGDRLVEYNFCEIKPVSIAGRVFVDLNHDCMFDENEQPLSGVKIELLDGNGIVVETTFTDASGQYHFDNLLPNTYSVHEFQPGGYLHHQPYLQRLLRRNRVL